MRAFALTLALLSAAAFVAPASAQDAPEARVNQLIVYGNDPCPQSEGSDITVCARKAETERFRIPEMFRGSESPQNEAWSNRVQAIEMVGRTGTQSCSPVGPGGSTGCLARMIDNAYAERGLQPDVKFADLVAAERARRLSTIDQSSAEEQARVESLERQYEARRLAEEAAASGTATASEPAPPPIPQGH
jgi:hypothetical protein